LGGATPASVTLEAFWSDTNLLFDAKYSIGGPFSYSDPAASPAFSSFAADLFGLAIAGVNPFSMTTIITITHGIDEPVGTQAESLTALSAVPVPAALPLLASAFAVLGLIRARRARA
jgi:hypothetical protein